jgi:hypothetical protein
MLKEGEKKEFENSSRRCFLSEISTKTLQIDLFGVY